MIMPFWLRRRGRANFFGGLRVAAVEDLNNGLVLDLDAHYGVGLSGGDVATWADGSGLGHDFAEATNRPEFSAADANWGNRPSIQYTAANTDRLQSTEAASVWKFLHDGTGSSIGFVFRSVVTGNQLRLAGTANAIGNVGTLVQVVNGRFMCRLRNGGGDILAQSGPTHAPGDVRHSGVVTLVGDQLLVYVDGILRSVPILPFTPSSSDPTATLRIGLGTSGTNAFAGEINAVHAWNRAIPAVEVAKYHQWAKDNWI